MITYEEHQRVLCELRKLRDAIKWHEGRFNYANSVMSKHKVGPYKYTETDEERFQKQIDLIGSRIEFEGKLAANRIRRYVGLNILE